MAVWAAMVATAAKAEQEFLQFGLVMAVAAVTAVNQVLVEMLEMQVGIQTIQHFSSLKILKLK